MHRLSQAALLLAAMFALAVAAPVRARSSGEIVVLSNLMAAKYEACRREAKRQHLHLVARWRFLGRVTRRLEFSTVARIERSRSLAFDRMCDQAKSGVSRCGTFPDFASLNPGYDYHGWGSRLTRLRLLDCGGVIPCAAADGRGQQLLVPLLSLLPLGLCPRAGPLGKLDDRRRSLLLLAHLIALI